MASPERTAYPQFPRVITARDLAQFYTPTAEEIEWASRRYKTGRLGLLVLLKSFQQLHYFPTVETIPNEIVDHIRSILLMPARTAFEYREARTLYRHCAEIRDYLGVKRYYGKAARREAVEASYRAAEVMDRRVDIINAVIDELISQNFELPAFSSLDKLAEAAATTAQERLYQRIGDQLTVEQQEMLDRLLTSQFDQRQTALQAIKALPKRASKKHLEAVLEQLTWLESLGDVDHLLKDVPPGKLQHLAHQASLLDADDLRRTVPARRNALLLALIHRMQVRARDDVAEMFIRRVGTLHKRAKEELAEIQQHQRELTENLVSRLDGVLEILAEETEDAPTGRRIRAWLAPGDSLESLRDDCATVRVWSGSNHLPLLWKFFASHRAVLMRLIRALKFVPATQNRSLLDALEVVLENEGRRSEWITESVPLAFCSERWRKLIKRPDNQGPPINRRFLEVCVFSHLASELKSGDTCILGSENFADYREHLLSWSECETGLQDYCDKMGIPSTAQNCIEQIREQLRQTAATVDAKFPDLKGDVSIGKNGQPVLRRVQARDIPPSAITLHSAVTREMPVRPLLDILANIEHWTHFTRHFGPISGHEPKIRNAVERYLQTVFAIGCGLGVNQAARHFVDEVTPHMLSRVHRRHITAEKLEAAHRELVELYLRLDLPRIWGEGKRVAADGTQYDFYDQNLLAGYHFRYRKMGAVAYRHVADNYIATFQHFIPPGIWEAIYVIEGLLKAKLSVEADTVYSDTQGQSVTVFAFTYLLGIHLLPRIRNWKDLDFFRPDKDTTYRHIDGLFAAAIDWELIETHWRDLMQIALSIQAGRIASPLLLRRLSASSQRNRLFLAAQELGRAQRTIFLLKWISSLPLRQEVTAETNKIEAYNGFAKYFSFGGDVIPENDPDEQQKRLLYNDVIASAVILQNVVDMTNILQRRESEGHPVNWEDVSFMSPYPTGSVKRFGDYHVDMKRPPEPWIRERAFKEAAKAARAAAPSEATL